MDGPISSVLCTEQCRPQGGAVNPMKTYQLASIRKLFITVSLSSFKNFSQTSEIIQRTIIYPLGDHSFVSTRSETNDHFNFQSAFLINPLLLCLQTTEINQKCDFE